MEEEPKIVRCICGYGSVATKDGLALLRHHQSSCYKFRGEEYIPPKDEESWYQH